MSDEYKTEYTKPNPSRVIKRYKRPEMKDPNSPWFRITAFFSTIAFACVWQLVNYPYSQTVQYGLSAIALICCTLWLKYCGMNPYKAFKNWVRFFFWIDRKILKRHSFYRFTTGSSWWEVLLGRTMSVLYPVKGIYPGGLVQFDDDQWAVYADLKGKRLNQEQKNIHRMNMKAVLNGMFDYQMMKFFSTSKKNPRKGVIKYFNDLARKTMNKERAIHINALIQKLINDNRIVKLQRQYVMIGLGQHENLDGAMIARNSKVPAIMGNLIRAKLNPKLIYNQRKVENLLRESVSEMAVISYD